MIILIKDIGTNNFDGRVGMESLLWKFEIFGLEIGWAKDKQLNKDSFFEHHKYYCLLYIGKLRFWNKKSYYNKENKEI